MALARTLVLVAVSAACLIGAVLAEPQLGAWPAWHQQGSVALNQEVAVIGTCQSSDRQLLVENVREASQILTIVKKIVKYPAEGQAGALISCVKLQPLKASNRGSAIVQKGGPGQRFAEIKVKSDRGHSLAWSVSIYGR